MVMSNVKKSMVAMIAAFVLAISLVIGGFAFSVRANAEEAPASPTPGKTIDMTEKLFHLVDISNAGKTEEFWEDSESSWADGSNFRYCDKAQFFTVKIKLPSDAEYLGMNVFVAGATTGGDISYSKDGETWTTKYYANPQWAQEDLSSYLVDNEAKTVYVKFSDKTPDDGNGIQIKMLSFARGGKIALPSDSTPPLLKKGAVDSISAAATADMEADKHYVYDDGGYSDGGKFRFYDGAAKANDNAILTEMGGTIGVYKFTYTEKAQGLELKALLNSNYILSVAKSVPIDDDGEIIAELFKNSNWTDIAIGDAKDHTGGIEVKVDISALMQDNEDKTVYVRIGDATDVVSSGGWLFNMSLTEMIKIDAPTFTNAEGGAVANLAKTGLGEIDLSTYKIVSADPALTAYTASVKAPGASVFTDTVANKFTPTAVGTYKVKLTATDANGTVGTVEFDAVVSEVPAVTLSSISIKTNPTKTTYNIGETLDVTGGKITAKFSDNSAQEIAITADMVSGYDKDKTGEQTLTVTYQGKTATFNVTVNEKEKKGCSGCGSVASGTGIGGAILILLMAAGLLVVGKKSKKRKEN